MVFLVVTYGCESCTTKKAERQRIDAFKLWCWRRLESPLDSKEIKPVNLKGDQPWIFIGRTNAEAETSILVIWCKQLTFWKSPWCWERLRADGEEGITGDGRRASLTQWTWTWENSGRWCGAGRPGMLQSIGSQRVGHDWATEQQQQQQRWMCNVTLDIVSHLPVLVSNRHHVIFIKWVTEWLLQNSVSSSTWD